MGSEVHMSAYGEDDYSYLEPDVRVPKAPQRANSTNCSNIIGKWVLQEELGSGSWVFPYPYYHTMLTTSLGANSTVRKAFHCESGLTAACKIISKDGGPVDASVCQIILFVWIFLPVSYTLRRRGSLFTEKSKH